MGCTVVYLPQHTPSYSMLLKVAVCCVLAVVTTVKSEDGDGYQDMGCWKARNLKGKEPALKNLEGKDKRLDKQNWKKREDAVNKCHQVARDMGYEVFGVGGKGKCWGGNGESYKDQGKARSCPDNGKGYNAVVNVYMIAQPTTTTTTTTTTAPTTTTTTTTAPTTTTTTPTTTTAKATTPTTPKATTPTTPETRTDKCVLKNINIYISSYKKENKDTVEECRKFCHETEGCEAWKYVGEGSRYLASTKACYAGKFRKVKSGEDKGIYSGYSSCIDDKTTTTTPATTTTSEPTTPCGKSYCITRTHYCSAMHFQVSSLFSSLCHEREASGAMCTTDKECMSQKCTFVWSKFSMRCT